MMADFGQNCIVAQIRARKTSLNSLADLAAEPEVAPTSWLWPIINAALLSVIAIRVGLELPRLSPIFVIPVNSTILLVTIWALQETADTEMAHRIVTWLSVSIPMRLVVASIALLALALPVMTVSCHTNDNFTYRWSTGDVRAVRPKPRCTRIRR
jgi:hypothetical protein